MSQAPRQSRGVHPIRKAASVFRMSGSTLMRLDPEGLRYVATLLRVDSGRGQDRTLRGNTPVECTKDGWS